MNIYMWVGFDLIAKPTWYKHLDSRSFSLKLFIIPCVVICMLRLHSLLDTNFNCNLVKSLQTIDPSSGLPNTCPVNIMAVSPATYTLKFNKASSIPVPLTESSSSISGWIKVSVNLHTNSLLPCLKQIH